MNPEIAERIKGRLEDAYRDEITALQKKLKEVLSLFYLVLGDRAEVRVPFEIVAGLNYKKSVIEIALDNRSMEYVITAGVVTDEELNEINRESAESVEVC
jgi:hypothetical protein